MNTASRVLLLISLVISLLMFLQPNYGADKELVMRQVLGATFLAFLAGLVISILSGLLTSGRRLRSMLTVFGLNIAFLLVIFVGFGLWADLFSW